MSQESLTRCLERVGQAISTSNWPDLANCWAFPALVLSDEGAITIADADSLQALFARMAQGYQSQGLVATRPELERIEPLSEKLTAVDVRWPTFDAAGTEKAVERSHYLLQLGEDQQQRIRVALTRTR
jgi:hypothetical protein